MMAATHYLFSEIDPEAATYFFDRLFSGADLAKDNPILHLRNLILKNNQVPAKIFPGNHRTIDFKSLEPVLPERTKNSLES